MQGLQKRAWGGGQATGAIDRETMKYAPKAPKTLLPVEPSRLQPEHGAPLVSRPSLSSVPLAQLEKVVALLLCDLSKLQQLFLVVRLSRGVVQGERRAPKLGEGTGLTFKIY